MMTALLSTLLALGLAALGLAVWNALAWPAPPHNAAPLGPCVSLLVPARDEESHIAACLDTILEQGNCVVEAIVCDDHSADRTAEIVRQRAECDERVRLIAATPLPEGWCGKPHACHQLALAAHSEWLLFLDADTRLQPGAVARIVTAATRHDATLVSCWPGLDMHGFWEGLLMPMLNFVVYTLHPAPLALLRKDPALGLAHGACILAHRETYLRTGGHVLVRHQLFEDTQLARQWRTAGERTVCLDGQDIGRVRMYDSLPAIWNGFQKNFYPAFQRRASFWVFWTGHSLVFLAPFIAAATAPTAGARFLASAAGLSVIAARIVLALRFRHPLWSAALHPIAEAAFLTLGLVSWWKFRNGSGVEWKGRFYRATSCPESEP